MARLAEQAATPPARFATPEAAVRTFATALGKASLGVALDCFAAEACLVTPDATAITGRRAIGDILAQLISQRVEIAIEPAGALIAGDLAFLDQRWRIILGRGSEHAHRQEVVPVLVLSCVRSEWKLAIVAPWGRP